MPKTFLGTTALAAAITLGPAAPAHAATITVSDPQDTAHGSDLLSVQVRNGERNVTVVTTHTNLRRSPRTGSSGAVYVDTDRRDKGPELVLVGGYVDGADYQLLHTEGFGTEHWGDPVDGSHEMTVDYATEQVRVRMSRAALGNPGKVRVAVRVSGTRSDGTSTGQVDWLGEPRSFTAWVAR